MEEKQDEAEKEEGAGAITLFDVLWPKKEGITLVKWFVFGFPLVKALGANSSFSILNSREHISILALHSEPLFFQHFDGPYFPTLKILHRCKLLQPSHSPTNLD